MSELRVRGNGIHQEEILPDQAARLVRTVRGAAPAVYSGMGADIVMESIIGALISLADHRLSRDDVAVLKESAPRLPDRHLRTSLLCVRTVRTLVPRYSLGVRGSGYLRRQPAPGHLESPGDLRPAQSSD